MSEHNHHKTAYGPVDKIPYHHMTEYMTISAPDNSRSSTGISQDNNRGIPPFPMDPDANTTSPIPPDNILPSKPEFKVPANPLLPPEYQETINYENVQYLNGFLRSQIGKYIKVTQLFGSETIEDQHGYLVGVGLNYILLQEFETGNIIAVDYYTLKEVYVYHTAPNMPTYAEL